MDTGQLLLMLTVVLSSFAGGLVAVLIGQFLAYYREKRSQIEELYLLIENIKYLPSEEYPYSIQPEELSLIINELRESFLENQWWMNSKLEGHMRNLIKNLTVMQRTNTQKKRYREKLDNHDLVEEEFEELDRRTKELAQKAIEQIEDDFSRVPFRKFIPRYLGYFNTG